MKLFSWSSLFFILSLSFLWGCGYWVWLQTNQSQQTQLTTQLSLQLERSEVLLEDWQRNYRLHLDYLRADLAKMTPPSTDNVMYEPWAELDDKIQHAPWPDALLGYALLDESGRAVRLSNNVAGQLFAITDTDFSSNHQFLTPMVLPSQWVAPVHLEFNSQHLLFWFDLAALKQKLLKAQQQAAGEVLLVSATAQLVSPSRYQQTLLARFGLSDLRDDQSLKFQLKRPPEDLTRSNQRYDGSMAWPATPLAQAMTTTKQGQTALFVPNYLGRPSVASWRWSDGWQAYLVAERDLSGLQQQLKQLRQYLVAGLSALSAVLLLLFWLIQRGVRGQESAVLAPQEPELPNATAPLSLTAEAVTEPDITHSADAPASVSSFPVTPAVAVQAPLTAATKLLQAWMTQPATDSALRAASACWLQQQPAEKNGPVGCQLRLQLSIWLSDLQRQLPAKAVLFDLAADVPAWAALDIPALHRALEWVIYFRSQQHDVSTVLVKTVLTTADRLQLEISDDGETIAPGQWVSLLQPGPNTATWPEPLRALQAAGGHLSAAQSQFSGNKLLLTLPLQIWAAAATEPELQLVDGAALLLCPAGDAQQLYRRMLKQTGLALMPLDDAAQFMQWCSAQNDARLDYLILDESFINADLQIAAQVFQVVRRYFPQLALLVLVRDPAQWLDLQQQFQLRLVSKPVLSPALQQALLAQEALVLSPVPQQVWYEASDPIEDWLLQQQLKALGFAPVLLASEQQLPANTVLMLRLENRLHWQSQLHQQSILWYTAQPVALDADEEEQLIWTFSQGLASLSQRLFQLSERLHTDEN